VIARVKAARRIVHNRHTFDPSGFYSKAFGAPRLAASVYCACVDEKRFR